MKKIDMREWVVSLESVIDNKLQKWKKHNPIENGESIQRSWQFGQTHIHLDIFWEDHQEIVRLKYLSPRGDHDFMWHGLTNNTYNKIMDRVGNLAQVTMHPPIDPME
jgi:hypothetical protein